MHIKRKDLYDFDLVLTFSEFESVKQITDFSNESIEDVLQNIYQCGFDVLCNGKKEKE